MLRFVRGVAVRRLARDLGKLAVHDYLVSLDLRVEELVKADVASIGSRRMLRAADVELRKKFNRAVTSARR